MLLSLEGLPIDIRQTLIVQLGDALQQLSLVQSFVSSERRSSLVKDALRQGDRRFGLLLHARERIGSTRGTSAHFRSIDRRLADPQPLHGEC